MIWYAGPEWTELDRTGPDRDQTGSDRTGLDRVGTHRAAMQQDAGKCACYVHMPKHKLLFLIGPQKVDSVKTEY
jgi:hypothetical protein